MTIYDDYPKIVTSEGTEDPFKNMMAAQERELQRVYKMGVLHGINAQSMAQVKNDVMAFEDYGWSMDE